MKSLEHYKKRIAHRLILQLSPMRYRLRFLYWHHRWSGEAEPELVHLDKFHYRQGAAIDVGANIGFYSYKMARLFDQVYAFEVNPDMTSDLKNSRLPNVRIFETGLSSIDGQLTLYTPMAHGSPLSGWASLYPGNCPDAQYDSKKTIRVGRLDSFGLHDIAFIKIDVEGHELEVLAGGANTIASCKPTVLIEVKNRNMTSVMAYFAPLGYECLTLRELTGVDGSPENRIFQLKI